MSSPVTPGGHGAVVVSGAAMTTWPTVNVDAGVVILYNVFKFFYWSV
jgi:hypothetical protein